MVCPYGFNKGRITDFIEMKKRVVVFENSFKIDVVEFYCYINLPVLTVKIGQVF